MPAFEGDLQPLKEMDRCKLPHLMKSLKGKLPLLVEMFFFWRSRSNPGRLQRVWKINRFEAKLLWATPGVEWSHLRYQKRARVRISFGTRMHTSAFEGLIVAKFRIWWREKFHRNRTPFRIPTEAFTVWNPHMKNRSPLEIPNKAKRCVFLLLHVKDKNHRHSRARKPKRCDT